MGIRKLKFVYPVLMIIFLLGKRGGPPQQEPGKDVHSG